MATLTKKRKTKKPVAKAKKDLSASYNQFKQFEGKQYSGMQVGRSHSWYYDKGDWKETKITPDLWEIRYEVIKGEKAGLLKAQVFLSEQDIIGILSLTRTYTSLTRTITQQC